MKNKLKLLGLIFIVFAVFSAANAFVEITAQETVVIQDAQQTIHAEISTNESTIDFSAILPLNVNVAGWNVIGISSDKYSFSTEQMEYLNVPSNVYLWSFRELDVSDIKIELTVETEQNAQMHYVWLFPPNNFGSKSVKLMMESATPIPAVVLEESDLFFYMAVVLAIVLMALILFYVIKVSSNRNKRLKNYKIV